MSLFGAIVGGIIGGPIGAAYGDSVNYGGTATGTGPEESPPFTGQGTSGDDVVHIRTIAMSTLFGGSPTYDVEINGHHTILTKEQLEATVFDLGDGDDQLVVDPDVDANITARGGSGDDTMVGGKGNDRFDGGSGDDVLIGGDGNDSLKGGSGNDRLEGGPGRDDMDGGSGGNSVLRDLADSPSPNGLRNLQRLFDSADVVAGVSNPDAHLFRG